MTGLDIINKLQKEEEREKMKQDKKERHLHIVKKVRLSVNFLVNAAPPTTMGTSIFAAFKSSAVVTICCYASDAMTGLDIINKLQKEEEREKMKQDKKERHLTLHHLQQWAHQYLPLLNLQQSLPFVELILLINLKYR
jgi:hypothetical protein